MKLLLDTQIVLWSAAQPQRLSAAARSLLQNPKHDLLFSAASMWEIAIKSRLGRLDAPDHLPELVTRSGLAWLPVSADHVWRTREIDGLPHADPFDRLLLAQALYRLAEFGDFAGQLLGLLLCRSRLILSERNAA